MAWGCVGIEKYLCDGQPKWKGQCENSTNGGQLGLGLFARQQPCAWRHRLPARGAPAVLRVRKGQSGLWLINRTTFDAPDLLRVQKGQRVEHLRPTRPRPPTRPQPPTSIRTPPTPTFTPTRIAAMNPAWRPPERTPTVRTRGSAHSNPRGASTGVQGRGASRQPVRSALILRAHVHARILLDACGIPPCPAHSHRPSCVRSRIDARPCAWARGRGGTRG